jgi:DNA-binding transcriptional ArsR family regulator
MLTENHSVQVQGTFRALADPTRREILMMLSRQDLTIREVSDNFDMTRAAVKKHLRILEEGELIVVKTKGRERINQLQPQAIRTASEWLNYFNKFWDQRLSSLQQAVERQETTNQTLNDESTN